MTTSGQHSEQEIWRTAYQSSQGCVSWQGNSAQDSDVFNTFLQERVAARLNDTEGNAVFTEHLNGLSLTGMGQDALKSILAAEVPETRNWAAGEALAEAVLEHAHDVVLPWNTERDKRNPFASLPGADIVGFQCDGNSHRLALGEVKCSSEATSPPKVMSGRSGMTHQLDTLAGNLATICQLLKWLLPRIKRTRYEEIFNAALTRYLNSGNRDLALFGVLIRDQQARETDLQARGQYLATRLQTPTCCRLLALYVPCPITRLPGLVRQGGAA